MPMTPTRLVAVTQAATNVSADVYTVPATGVLRTVVKQAIVTNTGATAVFATLLIRTTGNAFFPLLFGRTIDPSDSIYLDLSQVLGPGEALNFNAGSTSMSLVVSGLVVT